MNNAPLTAGIVGATGHTGGELCRLLLGHPLVAGILPVSRKDEELVRIHSNLRGSGLAFVTPEELDAAIGELDAVFFCTPTGEAMESTARFLDAGVAVIDLSADFRFPDPTEYQRVHGRTHTSAHLLGEAAYGVTELNRSRIARSRLVANPGCYAITAVLGLTPFLDAGVVDLARPVSIHALNGTSGAGNRPRREVQVSEMAGSLLAYSLDGHRHGPELEHQFSVRTGHDVVVDFNTAHGDFARGIHLQANFGVTGPSSREELLEILLAAYPEGDPLTQFVHVNDLPRAPGINVKDYSIYPTLSGVVGSNHCHVGVDLDPVRGIAKVVAVTDNLIKGAAGSALQNMNVMLGLDEPLGLTSYAL